MVIHAGEAGIKRAKGPARRFSPGWINGLLVALSAGLVALSVPWPVRVIDGDTVDRWPFRYRLAGFDAPELRRARCPAERQRAQAAKVRLAELVAGAQRVRMVRTTWRLDPWWRVLARLEIDGRDVAEIALAEGWGAAYHGRGARRNWCSE